MDAPAGLVNALLAGNVQGAFKILLIFVVAHYGALVIAKLAALLRDGINWARGKANELPLLAATTIDDRFFDLLEKAVSNQVHLSEVVKEAFADGKVTEQELKAIAEAIWADFKANTGIADLSSFAMALLGNAQAPGAERAIRAKFDANIYRLLGQAVYLSSERTMTRRMNWSRMTAPTGPLP